MKRWRQYRIGKRLLDQGLCPVCVPLQPSITCLVCKGHGQAANSLETLLFKFRWREAKRAKHG